MAHSIPIFRPPPLLAGIVKFNYTTINKFFCIEKDMDVLG